jgi:hypothetical protein
MHVIRVLLKCLPLLAGPVVLPATADVSLRIMDNTGAESTIYVSAGRCRFEGTGMPGYTVIDTRGQSLVYADPAKHEYSTLSEAQLRERIGQVDQLRDSIAPHMDSLRGGLQALSPEQRAMFEQFMAGKAAPAAGAPVQLVADRGTQRFAGLACAHHRLVQGGRQVGDACLLQQPGGVMSPEDYTTLSTVLGLLREFSGSAGGLLAAAGNKSALLHGEVNGIPVALRDFSTGESYRVVSASPNRLDNQLFNGYQGYKQVDAPAIPGLF